MSSADVVVMVDTCVGPRVSGMLIIGLLLRNIPGIKFVGENIDSKWGSTLRYDSSKAEHFYSQKMERCTKGCDKGQK